MRTLFFILSLLFIPVLSIHAIADTRLSLKQCVDLALANQPALKTAGQNVNAGKGRETQARSPLFPQLSGSTGYSKSFSEGGALGESITRTYTTNLSLNMMIYDFGRTGNTLEAAQWNTRSSEWDRERTAQDVVLNVKQAYYALLAAKNLVEVSGKRLEQTESHLRQAEAFFRAGSKPRFDVTRAEVDVNNARLGLLNARNNVRIQTIVLNNAMGIDPGLETDIEPALPGQPEVGSREQCQAEALQNRPEVQKTEADIEAAKARLRSEEAGYYPTLSASGAYNWATGTASMGSFQGDIGNSWNTGVMLSVPFFQGGLTRGRVSEARANHLAVQVQRDATRQTILLQVNQSYADMESAKLRIEVMESALQKARESLALAEGRYQAGIGPSIEVTDAQLAAIQAEIDHIQAQYDYQLSLARLFKAMGRSAV